MSHRKEESRLRCVGVADVRGMGDSPGLEEPQRSCQCPGTGRDGAGETQGIGEEEGAHAWPVAGLGAACKRLGPNPTTPPALGGADE